MYFQRKTADYFRSNFSSIQTLILRFGYLWFTELSVDLLISLGERYLFVCCSLCFVKRGNNHYSVHVINTS